MNKFYSVAEENQEPENPFTLKNLGKQIKYNGIVNYGAGILGIEEHYRQTTLEDYDNSFVDLLYKTQPIYKITELLDFHLKDYINKHNGDKSEFMAQIKYVILSIIQKQKNKEGYISLLNDWLIKKDANYNQNTKNVYNIKTGNINAPTQLQQNSDNSTQIQHFNYNKEMVQELFALIKADIEKINIAKEEFYIEIDYALKQLNKGKDIQNQLLNIGSLIKDVGLPLFVNLASSGIFEFMKPALGFS